MGAKSLIWCFSLLISYGVVSLPEVNDWQPLTVNDSYLVAATDGVFEKLNSQDICDVLWELESDITGRSGVTYSCSYSLADCIVNAAVEKGTTDNMAAVVLPLISVSPSEAVMENICDGASKFDCSALEYEKHLNEQSGDVCRSGFCFQMHSFSLFVAFMFVILKWVACFQFVSVIPFIVSFATA